MADGVLILPLSKDQIENGPFSFPPPVSREASQLYKNLYKLLNYLAIEWCGGYFSTQLRVSFGFSNMGKCYDLGIVVSNCDIEIKKQKLDEVFSECEVLHPFLEMSVSNPSLIVTGTLSPNIQHYHKLWATPRGMIVQAQPYPTRDLNNTSLLSISFDFRVDIEMKRIKDMMYYFLVRLNIGCHDSLMIDINLNPTPRYYFPFGRHYKSGVRQSARSDGHVDVKICRACQSCRVQTSKSKEITIQKHKFNVKISTRRCFGLSNKCTDKGFRGKLTILGPGSIPVLHQTDEDFHNQFNSLVGSWACMSDNETHLILIFECKISAGNVHEIMSLLHDTCFQVFSKHQSSFLTSVNQLLNKPSSSSSGVSVDLTAASRNLARAITEIVELSRNDDFRNSVKELIPHDSMESLHEVILNRSRQFGIREKVNEGVDCVTPSPKRRKTITMGRGGGGSGVNASSVCGINNVSVGGICFTQTEDDTTPALLEKSSQSDEKEVSDLDDFESLQ